MTNVRTDAVLKAAWDQIDLNAALWTVPLASLKDRAHRSEPFRVPLSPRAVEIVREMESVRRSQYMFPSLGSGQPLSNMSLLTLLKRMNSGRKMWLDKDGRPITAHGFRATFRTWAEEVATVPHAVIEQAMGHQVGNSNPLRILLCLLLVARLRLEAALPRCAAWVSAHIQLEKLAGRGARGPIFSGRHFAPPARRASIAAT
jgi:integrase